MSGEVSFSLAAPADDDGIRRLLATNEMPGRIRIRFEREPDYFAGCGTMGETDVLVARSEGTVVGVACRATRRMFINGSAEEIGYLGQLRVDRNFRGRWLVARGFRMLRELHDRHPVRGYVTTIVEGNPEAEGVLVHRARGVMPRYRKVDRLLTLALAVPRRNGAARNGSPVSVDDAVALLNREGSRKNFFPVYDRLSFDNGTTRGFDPRDFVAVERREALVGIAGLWDQSAYKQTVVAGYDELTSVARPLYNTAARIFGRPRLPRPGSALRFAYGSFFCAVNDDPEIARELIEGLLALAAARGLDHLLLGFAESDSLLAVARSYRHAAYASGVYTVAWDGDEFHDHLDRRPRYLEIAAL